MTSIGSGMGETIAVMGPCNFRIHDGSEGPLLSSFALYSILSPSLYHITTPLCAYSSLVVH